MKHTPGPWIAEQPFEVISEEGWAICDVDNNDGGDAESNARLIAAAPDLLKACLDALVLVELDYTGSPEAAYIVRGQAEGEDEVINVIDALKAAIDKAEGGVEA